MDEDQVQAYNLMIGGHNLCLTGQSGTGKSDVVKKAVKELEIIVTSGERWPKLFLEPISKEEICLNP
jgi:dephospho-CoA kinase